MTTKAITAVIFLVALVTAMALVGCKEGPAGPKGDDGQDLFGGSLEGFAAGIKCGTCHIPETDTTYFVLARSYQWAQSKHAVGGDLERNGGNCAGCHTTEGFMQMMKSVTGPATIQAVSDKWQPSPPGCFACHSAHQRGDFSLRIQTPVTVTSYVTGVADQTFDYGKGNLCVRCHQTRTTFPMSPKPDPTKTAATDTITITSSRWYPHYGVQGQMLMGTGGFQFSGATFTGNSAHSNSATIKANGCPTCHMAEQVYSSTGGFPTNAGTGKGGGHTMNVKYHWPDASSPESQGLTGCKDAACHGSAFSSFDYKGVTTSPLNLGTTTAVKRYLDTLQTLLLDTAIVNKFNAGAKKAWIAIRATDSSVTVNAGSGANALKIRPASRAGALFNFLFIEHDRSHGAHNTKYTVELLKASIAELRKP